MNRLLQGQKGWTPTPNEVSGLSNRPGFCEVCGSELHEGRVELGMTYCMPCGEEYPRLATVDYVVVGQHKGPPLVLSPSDPIVAGRENTMNRG